MSVRNQAWYDLNESRPWPLDDTATLLADDGSQLPHDVIADISLRFPSVLGDRAFVSAVTVGPNIVTVILLGSAGGFTPMASVSIQRPVEPHVHYELEQLYPGVGGWIVFGGGVNDTEVRSWRFSSATQSLLLAQTARKYSSLPVASVGLEGAAARLTGMVRLQGGSDLTTRVEERVIDGVARDAVVIGLKDKQENASTRNLLELYAGDCGKRPESGNCGDPQPIEFINTVAPNCCGNIFLEFRGCGEIYTIEGECGVVIDCGFGLGDACVTPDRLPDNEGRLPNEYADQCDGLTDDNDPTPPVAPTSESYVLNVRSAATTGLPYLEDFNDYVADDLSLAGDWVLTSGGNGSGGVASVTNSGGFAKVTFDASPDTLPSSFTVTGCSVSAYNTTHTVTSVVSSLSVVTNVAYTADGSGGAWEESAASGGGSSGVVLESQPTRENLAVWDQNLPSGWDSVHKQVATVVTIQAGPSGGANNGGLILNYADDDNFWLLEIDWDNEKTFRLAQKYAGIWHVRSQAAVPDLARGRRYRLTAKILPMDEAGGSLSAVVDATLEGIDDSVSHVLEDVTLPGYMPASGYFGLYANRSLAWFEELRVSDYNPS